MRNVLLLVAAVALAPILSACSKRVPDFELKAVSPSGRQLALFAGYQPRGTIEGYLTVSLTPRDIKSKPQLTFGHMLNVRAGWLDEHTFGIVFDQLEQRRLTSPVYPSGEAASAIEIVTCNSHYADCSKLLERLSGRALSIKQFPEGDWPQVS